MKAGKLVGCLALVCMMGATTLVRAETAAEAASKGKAMLVQGDLQGALTSYHAAALADRRNADYLQQFTLVRQALDLQTRMKSEQDPERWQYFATGLHAFFTDQEAHPAALAVSKEIHTRVRSGASGLMVAETALAMGENQTALDVLSALDAAEMSASAQALRGVALARLGKKAEAAKVAAELKLADDATPPTVFAAARLYALTGQKDKAMAALGRAFEATPPSKLEAVKQQVQLAPEFVSMAAAPEFVAVLKTESKVPESKCSGGSGCANCPMRGNCSKGK